MGKGPGVCQKYCQTVSRYQLQVRGGSLAAALASEVLPAPDWDTGSRGIPEPPVEGREEVCGRGFKQMSNVIRFIFFTNNHSGHREDSKD